MKIVLELSGFKPLEQTLDVRKSQTIIVHAGARAAHGAARSAGERRGGAGAEVLIDGAAARHDPEHVRAAGRPPPDRGEQGGPQAVLRLVRPAGGRAAHARRRRWTSAEAPTGTLLVTSDAGGDVYVDGQRKDAAPAIISGLPAGDHVVEVRKDGFPPWRQTVTVAAGQQVKVAANFGAAASGNASLRVISNEPDVEIFVDGEDKGKAPVTISRHQARASTSSAARKTRSSRGADRARGGRRERHRQLPDGGGAARPAARGLEGAVDRPQRRGVPGRLQPGARAGRPRTTSTPASTTSSVHKDGFTDFKREIVLVENQSVTLVADLSATGALRILSTPEGADVRIDGELIGKTPVQRDAVAGGDHVVEFKLKGYFDHKETMKVEGGREKVFSVDLKAAPHRPHARAGRSGGRSMSSFGAKVNPVGGVTADFGLGYPYYLTARLMVGALSPSPGMDVGVEFQTFFDISNLALAGSFSSSRRARSRSRSAATWAAAPGTNGRDTYFVDAGAIASLAFATSPPSTGRCGTRFGRTSSARPRPR